MPEQEWVGTARARLDGVQGHSDLLNCSSLDQYLAALRPILDRPGVTEVCINRPGEVFVEDADGWQRVALPVAQYAWALSFVKLIAASTQQRIDPECPLLTASLPSGERVQAVIPPATLAGRVVIAIRRPSAVEWGLSDLAARGAFGQVGGCSGKRGWASNEQAEGLSGGRRVSGAGGLSASGDPGGLARVEEAEGLSVEPCAGVAADGRVVDEEALGRGSACGDVVQFLARAVRARKNILVSGATGSGKTTLTRALIAEIDPTERLVSIEDAAELSLATHANSVRLFYSKDGQGASRVTPKQLLAASLRLRPDRILLAELRGEEAYDYLRNVNSGHPGSITSVHASSCTLAFEQLTLLVKESPAGREMRREDIRALLGQTVDVVVQCGRDIDNRRGVQAIWMPKE